MFQVPRKWKYSEMYTIYDIMYTLYGSHCRKKNKNGKTWRNEVDTKNSKKSNFRDLFLNIEKEFYHTVKEE